MADSVEGSVRLPKITEVMASTFLESVDGAHVCELDVLEVGTSDVRGHEEQSGGNSSSG